MSKKSSRFDYNQEDFEEFTSSKNLKINKFGYELDSDYPDDSSYFSLKEFELGLPDDEDAFFDIELESLTEFLEKNK